MVDFFSQDFLKNPSAEESVVLFETVTCLFQNPSAEEISFRFLNLQLSTCFCCQKEQLLLAFQCFLCDTSEAPSSDDDR